MKFPRMPLKKIRPSAALLAALLQASTGAYAGEAALVAVDPAASEKAPVQTLADLKGLSSAEQSQYCSSLSSDPAGSGGGCGDVLNNALAASESCMKQYPPVADAAKMTQVLKLRNACQAKINACVPQAASNPIIVSSSLPKDLRDYCSQLLAGAASAAGGSIIGSNPPPSPSATDQETSSGTAGGGGNDLEAEKDQRQETSAVNAVPFAIAALVLGSFFGGPLVIAAFAAVAFVGFFTLSNYFLNPHRHSSKKK